MKIKYILYSILIAIGIAQSSCNTSSVSIQALKPADISLPSHVQTVVIVNRSRPTKNGQVINVLEGIITGEGIGMDRMGGENAVNGLMQTLSASPRFKVIKANMELKGSGTGWFPDPLPTSEVRRICEQYKADALITLEAFDSNNQRNLSERKKKITKDGKEIEQVFKVAAERITVTAGWRLYDGKEVSLLDEFRMNNERVFSQEAPTEAAAIAALPSISNMVSQVGGQSGDNYAFRIAPQWVWLAREYYTGKHSRLKKAKSRVRANDWAGAAEIWKPLTTYQPDRKAAGRACYNMAVACEVQGRLEDALEWAKKSSYDYQNKKARGYIGEINRRIAEQKRVDAQMQK